MTDTKLHRESDGTDRPVAHCKKIYGIEPSGQWDLGIFEDSVRFCIEIFIRVLTLVLGARALIYF